MITTEQLEKITDKAYDIYVDGGAWDAIVLSTLHMLDIDIEGVDMKKALEYHGVTV